MHRSARPIALSRAAGRCDAAIRPQWLAGGRGDAAAACCSDRDGEHLPPERRPAAAAETIPASAQAERSAELRNFASSCASASRATSPCAAPSVLERSSHESSCCMSGVCSQRNSSSAACTSGTCASGWPRENSNGRLRRQARAHRKSLRAQDAIELALKLRTTGSPGPASGCRCVIRDGRPVALCTHSRARCSLVTLALRGIQNGRGRLIDLPAQVALRRAAGCECCAQCLFCRCFAIEADPSDLLLAARACPTGRHASQLR